MKQVHILFCLGTKRLCERNGKKKDGNLSPCKIPNTYASRKLTTAFRISLLHLEILVRQHTANGACLKENSNSNRSVAIPTRIYQPLV